MIILLVMMQNLNFLSALNFDYEYNIPLNIFNAVF